MSEIVKQRKYNFVSSVKLPKLEEIIEAASDFSAPTDKKIVLGDVKPGKKDISDITKQAKLSKEQMELQKLGIAVADAELQRAKEKELARAEELRRLCRERELMAQKRAEEEAMKASDGTTAKKKEAEKSVETVSAEAPVKDVEEKQYDLSEVAENPFDDNFEPKQREPREKEEFHETVLEDDYQEEMGFLDDSSESVDDDFLDF